MDNNLPNRNNNPWNTPQNGTPEPPTTPNLTQPSPNVNNTVDPVQSWVAQHEQRDASGKFVKSEHLTNGQPQSVPTSQNTPNLPSPVSFTQNNKYSEKNDPPLVAVSVTNPVTYLKLFLKRLLKNEGIDIHLKIKPLTVIACVLALSTAFGTGFNVAQIFFPTSSPLLHRSITLQGNIQKSSSGQYFLSLPDNSLWTLRPKTNNIDLTDNINKQVMVKGNLTAESNVIEVKEVITFEKPTPVYSNPVQIQPTSATNSAQPILSQ